MSLFTRLADWAVPPSALRLAKSGPSVEETMAILDYHLERLRAVTEAAIEDLAQMTRFPPKYLEVPTVPEITLGGEQ